MGVDLQSKVLEGVAVPNRPARVGLRHADNTRVLAGGVVLDDTLANARNVQESVEQVRCPVEVSGTVGDIVAKTTQALERTAELIRQIADHGLGGSVRAAPVSSPTYPWSVNQSTQIELRRTYLPDRSCHRCCRSGRERRPCHHPQSW